MSLHAAERLSPSASLRDHAIRDVNRLSALTEAAVQSGSIEALLNILKTKWVIAERAGLLDKPDAPLQRWSAVEEATARGQIAVGIRKADRLSEIFNRFLTCVSGGESISAIPDKAGRRAAMMRMLGIDADGDANPDNTIAADADIIDADTIDNTDAVAIGDDDTAGADDADTNDTDGAAT
jgi:hypothetical protein